MLSMLTMSLMVTVTFLVQLYWKSSKSFDAQQPTLLKLGSNTDLGVAASHSLRVIQKFRVLSTQVGRRTVQCSRMLTAMSYSL